MVKEPALPPESPSQATPSVILVNPMASIPSELLSVSPSESPSELPPDDNDGGVHSPDAIVETEERKITAPPSLTLQEVKEKWEYIRRRVKSQSKKGGPKIDALLNRYTIVGIEEHSAIPIVVIATNDPFCYTPFKQQTYSDTIEWALKVELKRDCKIRILPPGQGGSSLGVSIPTPPPAINGTTSHTTFTPQESQPLYLADEEPPTTAPKNVTDTPLRPQAQKTQVAPPPQEEPQARSDQGRPVSSATIDHDVPSQPSPLARTTDVRENTARVSTSDSRLLFAQKKAKNDQVVQEVVRLFKAEVKDIQLK